MGSLFSEEGKRRLEELARPGLLCGFDFDGTLAPLVPVPDQAWLPDDIRDRLVSLACHAPVAIITGRSVEDIRTRLGFAPDFVVGNHGLEGIPGWEAQSAQHRRVSAAWLAQLDSALRDKIGDPGIQLEDKRYSISVHYRMARDPARVARELAQLFGELSPAPRVIDGKYVFNLVAEDAVHKGLALERLMKCCRARHAVYVGDDVTDEDVFRMRLPGVLSVRVERHEDSAADFYIEQPEDIVRLLDELVIRLRARGARNWLQADTRSRA